MVSRSGAVTDPGAVALLKFKII